MILCLYHDNCMDGFAAAMAVYRYYFNEKQLKPDIFLEKGYIFDTDLIMFPVQYSGTSLGDIINTIKKVYPTRPLTDLLIVDFSFDKESILNACLDFSKVIVIDHHATAKEQLVGEFPLNCHVVFDMTESGATLTWKTLIPSLEMPPLFAYIKDRDLWQWNLPDSKQVSAYLQFCEKDMILGQILLSNDKTYLSHAALNGELILEVYGKQIKNAVKNAQVVTFSWKGFSVTAPTVNSPIHQSEIGNELCNLYPANEVALIYFDDLVAHRRVYSVRSKVKRAKEVAELFGGGGHPNAAGFSVPL